MTLFRVSFGDALKVVDHFFGDVATVIFVSSCDKRRLGRRRCS
jgi:hypothetical protein